MKMASYFFGLCLLCALICVSSGMMKEMTHLLWEDSMAQHPFHTPYQSKLIYSGRFSDHAPWIASNEITLGEHIGTHIDAPYHFYQQGKFLHEIPLKRFEGAAVVINIEEKAKMDPNAMVMPEDLQAWVEKNGKIPDGAWIIMASGWGKYWPDQVAFVGTNDSSKPTFNFPGFSNESAQWLLDNSPGFSGLASDTISCDNGYNVGNRTVPVHMLLMPNDYLCVEMLKEPELIPEAGATLHVWPINIYKGTAAPLRAYATWNENGEPEAPTCSAAYIRGIFGVIAMMTMASIL